MILRTATADDVAAVLALERCCFGVDAWSAGSVREELLGPRRTAVLAYDPVLARDPEVVGHSEVVGYAVASVVTHPEDPVDLQRIAVHPDRRRHGLAHDLLAAVGTPARMLLEVSRANTGARAFYAAEGFVEIGVRRAYYRDGSDAVIMERPGEPRAPR